jgi:hypothetical protein
MPYALGGLPYTSSPRFSAILAQSDDTLDVNGFQRVNRDFASKERSLVLYYFVNERWCRVREAKEGTGGILGIIASQHGQSR